LTKIPYDVTDVEAGGFDDDFKPGIYPAKIQSAEHRTQKSNGEPANDIHVVFNMGEGKVFKHLYINLDPGSEWKMAEFITALGARKKGSLDLNKIIGKAVRVKLNADTYEGKPTTKIGTVMKAKPGADEPADEPEDEPEEEEVEEDEAEDEEPEEEEEDDEEEEEVDLSELSRLDLKAFIKENSLAVRVTKSMSDDDIREKIAEVMPSEDEEEEEESDEEPEEEDDYGEWSLAQLKSELKGREITVKSPVTKDKAIAALRKDDKEEAF